MDRPTEAELIKKWLREHLDLSCYRVNDELILDFRIEGETIATSYIRDIEFKEK